MRTLDRIGDFKAHATAWKVKTFGSSKSVAVAIEFAIDAQLTPEALDYAEYEEHRVWGDFFVVGKDGQPLEKTVTRLVSVLGWTGSLRDIVKSPPPDHAVQITVESEEYQGKTYFKVKWLNAEGFVPNGGGADAAEVDQLEAQFGSLLRAAAGSAKKAPPKQAAKAGPPKAPPEPLDPASIPF